MSLSSTTISIVKATAPVVAARKDEISQVFYDKLFTKHPQVMNIFPMSHQKSPDGKVGIQAIALANAVVAYALNIENLGALGPAVELIANKHVSFGVQPEHYTLVGVNLLEAIHQVLGSSVATKDILAAWFEAYTFLANLLMKREASISGEMGEMQGGWKGWRELKVVHKQVETPIHTSLYIAAPDRTPLVSFIPGQYIAIKVKGITMEHEMYGEYNEHIRNYSLTGITGQDVYRITVRRLEKGLMSEHIHDQLEVGDSVEVTVPCGVFTLEEGDGPVVLVGAGVGITPLFAIMKQAVNQNRKVVLIYRAHDRESFPLKQEVEDILKSDKNTSGFVFYTNKSTQEDPKEKMKIVDLPFSKDSLATLIPDKTEDFYICGPPRFIQRVRSDLKDLGAPDDRVQYELFGPQT